MSAIVEAANAWGRFLLPSAANLMRNWFSPVTAEGCSSLWGSSPSSVWNVTHSLLSPLWITPFHAKNAAILRAAAKTPAKCSTGFHSQPRSFHREAVIKKQTTAKPAIKPAEKDPLPHIGKGDPFFPSIPYDVFQQTQPVRSLSVP